MLTLWLINVLVKAALAVLLWVRRQHRIYPAFVTFVTFGVLKSFALLAMRHSALLYFYVFWIGAAVDAVIKLWLLIELFHNVFQTELLERAMVRRFYGIVAVLAAVSFALAFAFPSRYPVRAMAVIHTANAGASLTLCLTFVVILIGARIEGVYWLNRSLGIGYGLLMYLPLRVLIDFIEVPARSVVISRLNYAELLAFLGALLVWIRSFVRPEIRPVQVPAEVLVQYATSLKRSG